MYTELHSLGTVHVASHVRHNATQFRSAKRPSFYRFLLRTHKGSFERFSAEVNISSEVQLFSRKK